MKSYNLLVIEEISGFSEFSDIATECNAVLQSYIQFNNPENGKAFGYLGIKSFGQGSSRTESIRVAIENFMLGDIHVGDFRLEPGGCEMHNGINSYRVDIPEPFKSLFEQLFKKENFHMPKLLTQ